MQLNFYLSFPGKTEKAINFYQSVLGGTIRAMMKVAGSPAEEHWPAESRDDILHACLDLGNVMIMASDSPNSMYSKPQGSHICINLTDETEAQRLYKALSQDGEIVMQMEPTFFAKQYAMFADRFGTQWMIHCMDEASCPDANDGEKS